MSTSANPFPTSSADPDGSLSPTDLTRSSSSSTLRPPTTSRPPSGAEGAPAARGPTMQRVVQGAHEAIDRAADTAGPHLQRLEETLGSAGSDLQQRADRARELGEEWTESLRTTVREHPLAALGVALAVGMLLSRASR